MISKLRYILSSKEQQQLVVFVFLLTFGALLDTLTTALMLPLMNGILNPIDMEENSWRMKVYQALGFTSTQDFLVAMSVFVGLMYVLRGLYRFWISRRMNIFKAKTQVTLTDRMFRGYVFQPYSYHLHKTSSEIMQSVTQDVGRTFGAVMSILNLLSESLVALFLLTFLCLINPLLTLFAGGLIFIILIFSNRIIAKPINKAGQETRRQYILMVRGVQQGLGGLKSVKTNRREAYFAVQYHENYKKFTDYGCHYSILALLPQLSVETISMAGCFFIVAAFAAKGTSMDAFLPILATFALAAVRLMPAANKINTNVTNLRYCKPYVAATYDALLETQDALDRVRQEMAQETTRGDMGNEMLTSGVQARNLTFQYRDAAEPLFQNLNLFIPAAKSTAFVGPTGVGKTTLADLFLGLLQPQSGQILADGIDIRERPFWWARRVAYVPQQIYLCDGSVRENVAFGFDAQEISDQRIWSCLRDANMETFVRNLPDGLDTRLGERGVRFSGGQQQRIGIARALYLQPQFLVLDEATSALDTDTEHVVMDAIYRLSGRLTLLIVAHRLSTIEKCDRVYRLPLVENNF